MTLIDHLRVLEREYGTFQMTWDFDMLFLLISQVKIALRQPGNDGASAKIIKDQMESIIRTLDEASPGFADMFGE